MTDELPGNGPTPERPPTAPYRSGDFEAAARAAREQAAAAAATPASPTDEQAPATPAVVTPSVAPALAPSAAAAMSSMSSNVAGERAVDEVDPETEAAVASAVAEAEEAKAERESGADGVLAFFRELPVLLAVAFLLAFLLRTFVVQVFYIPSGSMIPTLEVNDRIVVEKITYLFRDPDHGEVVVFAGDDVPTFVDDSLVGKVTRGVGQFLGVVPANARDFVKRVIGLPGDEVVIDDAGNVSVNGVLLDEPYKIDDPRAFGPFIVPEGKIFFLGDNRPASADSRMPSGLGFVDLDHVVGRAMVIVWPFENAAGIGTPEYDPIPEGTATPEG